MIHLKNYFITITNNIGALPETKNPEEQRHVSHMRCPSILLDYFMQTPLLYLFNTSGSKAGNQVFLQLQEQGNHRQRDDHRTGREKTPLR